MLLTLLMKINNEEHFYAQKNKTTYSYCKHSHCIPSDHFILYSYSDYT